MAQEKSKVSGFYRCQRPREWPVEASPCAHECYTLPYSSHWALAKAGPMIWLGTAILTSSGDVLTAIGRWRKQLDMKWLLTCPAKLNSSSSRQPCTAESSPHLTVTCPEALLIIKDRWASNLSVVSILTVKALKFVKTWQLSWQCRGPATPGQLPVHKFQHKSFYLSILLMKSSPDLC